jgi:anti-sigma regulatory factor (Ser/Thr protein kinase)
MSDDCLRLEFDVIGGNFVSAGSASEAIKNSLKQLGIDSSIIRRTVIAMYEGEMNMVIHANGGKAVAEIYRDRIELSLIDHGPGIPDLDLAFKEGWSTASEKIRELGFGAGMGLPNMKKYSDNIEVLTEVGKGTTVKMLLKL